MCHPRNCQSESTILINIYANEVLSHLLIHDWKTRVETGSV